MMAIGVWRRLRFMQHPMAYHHLSVAQHDLYTHLAHCTRVVSCYRVLPHHHLNSRIDLPLAVVSDQVNLVSMSKNLSV